MKRNGNKFKSVYLLVLVSFLSCGKNAGILEPGMTSLSFQGTQPRNLNVARGALASFVESNPSLSVIDRDGTQVGTLTLTDVRLALKEIKIKLADEDADSSSEQEENENIKFRGPYIIDLINNSVSPELPQIQLSSGIYKQIEVKLAKLEESEVSAGDAMANKSIYLAGTYTGSTASGSVTDMPFVLSFELEEEFFLTPSGDSSQGFAISETDPNPIIVAFRLSRWLAFNDTGVNDKNVDFSEVAVTGNRIELTEESNGKNQKIWEVIRRGIKFSADYGKDADGDGSLESDEDDDPESEDSIDD